MGFYAPAQIVRCAVDHGVEAREVDVNHSLWDCTLGAPALAPAGSAVAPNEFALRLGMRQVDGLREDDVKAIVSIRDGIPADLNPHLFAPPLARLRSPLVGEHDARRHRRGVNPDESPHTRSPTLPRGGMGSSATCAICGGGAASAAPRWSASPPRMPSARSVTIAARRCGRCAACPRNCRCRCSIMPRRARQAPSLKSRFPSCRSPSMW